jgi:hypothetical protein
LGSAALQLPLPSFMFSKGRRGAPAVRSPAVKMQELANYFTTWRRRSMPLHGDLHAADEQEEYESLPPT